MMVMTEKNRLLMKGCDDDTKKWKTFRDSDPSPYRSIMTGMRSVPLKGKLLEIDDDGNDSDTSPSYRSPMTGMSSVHVKGKWLEIDHDGNPNVCISTSSTEN